MPATTRKGAAFAALMTGLTLLSLSAPLSAQSATRPIVMICGLEEEGIVTGWIPEMVMITRQGNGRVEVFDPILQQLVGRPIKAFVVADSAGERSYAWALAGVRNRSGQWTERLDFQLTVTKANARGVMTVKAQDYDNVITGRGQCGQPQD